MTRMGTEAGAAVEVMSGDKDSFQLASEDVTILYPKRGVSDLNRMTPAAVEEKYGVKSGQLSRSGRARRREGRQPARCPRRR